MDIDLNKMQQMLSEARDMQSQLDDRLVSSPQRTQRFGQTYTRRRPIGIDSQRGTVRADRPIFGERLGKRRIVLKLRDLDTLRRLSEDARYGHAACEGPDKAGSCPGHAFQEASPVDAIGG